MAIRGLGFRNRHKPFGVVDCILDLKRRSATFERNRKRLEELENEVRCFTCNRKMEDDEHNYGTDEYPTCIQCAGLPDEPHGN